MSIPSTPLPDHAPASASAQAYRSQAFGLCWDSDAPLHQFEASAADSYPADVTVRRAERPLQPRRAAITIGKGALCADGVRYRAGAEVTFDMFGGDRIEWTPGPAWAGEFPSAFFSTVAALLLAWRGATPLHGSAVEIEGRAVLICGGPGAGKSTLAAGLIAQGARLISDDLSVLFPGAPGSPPQFMAGRPDIRLFPAVSGLLRASGAAGEFRSIPGDKDVWRPARVGVQARVPVHAVILLGGDDASTQPSGVLESQVFRPRWMQALPGYSERLATIAAAVSAVRVVCVPMAEVIDSDIFNQRAKMTLRLLFGAVD